MNRSAQRRPILAVMLAVTLMAGVAEAQTSESGLEHVQRAAGRRDRRRPRRPSVSSRSSEIATSRRM
jgi:hypothetical protein